MNTNFFSTRLSLFTIIMIFSLFKHFIDVNAIMTRMVTKIIPHKTSPISHGKQPIV